MIKIVEHEGYKTKEEFLQEVEKNAEVRRAYEGTSFPEGTKLLLEVEVTDRYQSQVIFGLLLNPQNIEGSELLGFKINAVNFGSGLSKEAMINRLQAVIEEIRNS